MRGNGEERTEAGASIAPGALTALLERLARAPPDERAEALLARRPGEVVAGRFELLRELGRGGFGVVYEARDRALGRIVAFKGVRTGNRGALRERLLRGEAEAVARLSHPNIVSLFDLGQDERGPYLILELLRGGTLADRIAEGPLPLHEALRIAVEVARGLGHAHAEGVVHRDLKPQNVFLCDGGAVKVLDFGLAHAFGTRGPEGGTPAYMAPEQRRGAPEDERTDVFALGVILWEMLAGRRPFPPGDGERALLSRSPAPALEVPGLPALGELVARMLAKDPVSRPRDGREVAEALRRIAPAGNGAAAAPVRVRGRGPLRLAALAAVGVALGAGGALLAVGLRNPASSGGRVVVAVADFANETRDPELDGLSGLLITSLQQSGRLRVLTRSRLSDLVRAVRSGPVDRIDEPLAREVGRRAKVRALLLGSVRRLDDTYAVEVRALDPVGDEYLFALQEQARGKSGVLPLIDRLSERTRLAFQEGRAEVAAGTVPVADVLTGSLEAHRSYFEGERCLDRGLVDECGPHFQRALSLDRDFAMAHYRKAWVDLWSARPVAEVERSLAEAVRLLERVPAADRPRIQALAAQVAGRDLEAAALYREAVARGPDDRALLAEAGDFFATRNDHEAALPFLRRAFDLEPAPSMAGVHLALALGNLGRDGELRELARRLEARPSQTPSLQALLFARAMLGDGHGALEAGRRAVAAAGTAGERDEARRWLWHAGLLFGAPGVEAELRGDCGAFATMYLRVLLGAQGRRAEALRLFEGDRPECPVPGDEERAARRESPFHQKFLAAFLTGDGDASRVWPLARRAAELSPPLGSALAVHLAYLGDLPHAEELARFIAPGSPRRRLLAAVVRWRSGDRAAARAELGVLHRESPGTSNPPVLPPAFLYGELLAEEGDDAGAVEALRRFQSLFHPMPDHWAWTFPRSRYLVARSLERLGRREEARAEIEALLALWKDADPGHPLLAEARAIGARLGAR